MMANKIPTYRLKVYPYTKFFSHSVVSHCKSHNRTIKLKFVVDRLEITNQNFYGTASHYIGGWFYEFFDEGKRAIGWNNQFVYYDEILTFDWYESGEISDERLDYARNFRWWCQNPVDDLAVTYEQIQKRWANPFKKFEDLMIPDEWEMLCEAPSSFAEAFNGKILSK